MSESELEEMIGEVAKMATILKEISETLWHHCIEDESENEMMMRAYPGGPKDLPAYLVNAQLIDDIYQMCKGYIDTLGTKEYPKPTP